MVILTWVTFFALFAILKKFAWKPILQILDDREKNIRAAVEEAEKTRQEYLLIGDKRKHVLLEADNAAQELMNQSRQSALKAAKLIEERAKSEAEIVMENARREIEAEQEKSAVYLREQSANTAVELARRILRGDLDEAKQKKIIDTLTYEI